MSPYHCPNNPKKKIDEPNVTGQSISTAESVSEHLHVIYEKLTTLIVEELEAKELFIKKATDDELFVLKRKLSVHKEEHVAVGDLLFDTVTILFNSIYNILFSGDPIAHANCNYNN